jgi:hypothetical protein
MNPLTLYAIVAATAFSLGFGTAWKLQSGKIYAMDVANSAANLEATRLLETARYNVDAAEQQALKSNQELDKANAQNIETINALDAQFDGVVMRDPGAKGCQNPMPVRPSARVVAKVATPGRELSAAAQQFLRAESLRANKITVDYNSLLVFVQNKCNIR